MPKHLSAHAKPILMLFLTLLSLAGMGRDSSRAADAGDDRALQTKLGLFIECINHFDSPLRAAYRAYRQTVGILSADPDSKEILDFHGFGIGPTGGYTAQAEKCLANLDASLARPPKIGDLDQTAADYAAMLRRLIPLTPAVDAYYAQAAYRDDRFVRGRTLDETIAPVLNRFALLSDTLRDMLQRETTALRRRQLAEIEAREGRKILWQTRNFMIEARVCIDAFDELVERRDLSAETLDRIVAPLQAAFDGASAYAAAHPDELKAKEPGTVIAWTLVEPQGALFLRELKDLRRDLADTTLADDKLARRVNRGLQSIGVDYNNVIAAYNSTIR